jgi:hypothetical protein
MKRRNNGTKATKTESKEKRSSLSIASLLKPVELIQVRSNRLILYPFGRKNLILEGERFDLFQQPLSIIKFPSQSSFQGTNL